MRQSASAHSGRLFFPSIISREVTFLCSFIRAQNSHMGTSCTVRQQFILPQYGRQLERMARHVGLEIEWVRDRGAWGIRVQTVEKWRGATKRDATAGNRMQRDLLRGTVGILDSLLRKLRSWPAACRYEFSGSRGGARESVNGGYLRLSNLFLSRG